jgi:hypothetical protein
MPDQLVMNVEISPELERELQDDSVLKDGINRGTEWLTEVVADSPAPVYARWGIRRDETNRRLVELTLSDLTASKTTGFADDEFSREWHYKRRLYSLWGDVLQDRVRRLRQELREAVQQLDEFEEE